MWLFVTDKLRKRLGVSCGKPGTVCPPSFEFGKVYACWLLAKKKRTCHCVAADWSQSPLVMNWSSLKRQGSLIVLTPWAANGSEGSMRCGVGMTYWPFGSLRLKSANACGAIFEPSGCTLGPSGRPSSCTKVG